MRRAVSEQEHRRNKRGQMLQFIDQRLADRIAIPLAGQQRNALPAGGKQHGAQRLGTGLTGHLPVGKHDQRSRIRGSRPENGRFLVEGLMHRCGTRGHGLGVKASDDILRDRLNDDRFVPDPS